MADESCDDEHLAPRGRGPRSPGPQKGKRPRSPEPRSLSKRVFRPINQSVSSRNPADAQELSRPVSHIQSPDVRRTRPAQHRMSSRSSHVLEPPQATGVSLQQNESLSDRNARDPTSRSPSVEARPNMSTTSQLGGAVASIPGLGKYRPQWGAATRTNQPGRVGESRQNESQMLSGTSTQGMEQISDEASQTGSNHVGRDSIVVRTDVEMARTVTGAEHRSRPSANNKSHETAHACLNETPSGKLYSMCRGSSSGLSNINAQTSANNQSLDIRHR